MSYLKHSLYYNVIGAPGVGQVMFFNQDCSGCS